MPIGAIISGLVAVGTAVGSHFARQGAEARAKKDTRQLLQQQREADLSAAQAIGARAGVSPSLAARQAQGAVAAAGPSRIAAAQQAQLGRLQLAEQQLQNTQRIIGAGASAVGAGIAQSTASSDAADSTTGALSEQDQQLSNAISSSLSRDTGLTEGNQFLNRPPGQLGGGVPTQQPAAQPAATNAPTGAPVAPVEQAAPAQASPQSPPVSAAVIPQVQPPAVPAQQLQTQPQAVPTQPAQEGQPLDQPLSQTVARQAPVQPQAAAPQRASIRVQQVEQQIRQALQQSEGLTRRIDEPAAERRDPVAQLARAKNLDAEGLEDLRAASRFLARPGSAFDTAAKTILSDLGFSDEEIQRLVQRSSRGES